MSRQVYCSWSDPTVHHEVDYAALNVTLVLVRQDLGARVINLQETVLGLVGLVDFFVGFFVVPDPCLEVVENLVGTAGKNRRCYNKSRLLKKLFTVVDRFSRKMCHRKIFY